MGSGGIRTVHGTFQRPSRTLPVQTLSRLAELDRLIFFRYPTKSHSTQEHSGDAKAPCTALQSGLSVQMKAPLLGHVTQRS
jgi:hypothetical protein